jgi:hypothetical protein
MGPDRCCGNRRAENAFPIRATSRLQNGRDDVIRSIAQFELNAKPMSNVFCAPLISDQVAWRGDNIGLPAVRMILANNDLQTGSSDLSSDHLGETLCGDAFLDHGEIPQKRK